MFLFNIFPKSVLIEKISWSAAIGCIVWLDSLLLSLSAHDLSAAH
jgi:hypothetical protein